MFVVALGSYWFWQRFLRSSGATALIGFLPNQIKKLVWGRDLSQVDVIKMCVQKLHFFYVVILFVI